MRKGTINIKKKLKLILFLFLSLLIVNGYDNFVNAADTSLKVSIERVDGGKILTDSINKPFYFSATSENEIIYMEMLRPHETIWEQYIPGTIIDDTWDNGKYTFKAYDRNEEIKECHIYYDTVKPIGKLYANDGEVTNGEEVEKDYVFIDITDELSGLDIVYVKKPGNTYYTEYKRNTYLYEPGTYYFYAVDYAGNISDTYSITLNKKPMVDIIYDNENNTIYLTWTKDDYLVFVDDIPYVKEEVFYDEGSYDVMVMDSKGNKGYETFIIDHLYKYVKTIWPTCEKEGYVLYQCITCNLEKEEINKDKIPHEFLFSEIPANCTENGYQLKTCKMCNYIEKTIISNPIGHNYIIEEKSATCTEDGGKVKKCLNCDTIEYINKIEATGHAYESKVTLEASCMMDGIRIFCCLKCNDTYQVTINKIGHNYILIDEKIKKNDNLEIKETIYKCHNCGDVKQDMIEINRTEKSEIKEVLENNYSYLVIILISLSGIWSIFMGVKYITAKKHSEVIEAKKYIINYIIGLVVIFSIMMITPFLINGIKAIL